MKKPNKQLELFDTSIFVVESKKPEKVILSANLKVFDTYSGKQVKARYNKIYGSSGWHTTVLVHTPNGDKTLINKEAFINYLKNN